MGWVCFSYFGIGKLVFIEGKMNSAHYVDMLSNNLFESARLMGLNKFIFQQDRDSKHTSKLTQGFFEENSIEVLNWSSQSPDMNSIEYIWALLKKNVSFHEPKNIAELKYYIELEWTKISKNMCQNYALYFKKSALQLYLNKGGYING